MSKKNQPQCALVAIFTCISLVGLGGIKPTFAEDSAARKAAKILEETKRGADPKIVYKRFNDFCKTHFGAEKEPLVYETFGKKLTLKESGSWRHISRQSAVIAFATNLPAMSYIEYGTSKKYGQKTELAQRNFYLHIHHLKNLKSKKKYYYRFVATDERGNKMMSKGGTFKTVTPAGAILLDKKNSQTPIQLNKDRATYILTHDIKTSDTVFEITANDITLDLNGHTVTFGNYGILGKGLKNVTVVNGFIVQDSTKMADNNKTSNFTPILFTKCTNMEIGGISIIYDAPQTNGITFLDTTGKQNLHHNIILDRGTIITYRHGSAPTAMWMGGGKNLHARVHHNLLKRARQNGLRFAEELTDNEIYIDSWSTNSFATGAKNDDCEVARNRIFVTGYHAIAIPWSTNNYKVHNNFIHMESLRTKRIRWWEDFGDQDSMNGLRLTNYGNGGQKRENLHWYENVVVGKLRRGAQMRGTEFFSDNSVRNLVCENTTIKMEVEDEKTIKAACVVAQGHFRKTDTLPIYYKNMTLISNICNIRFGDDYGKGNNHIFINTKFVRTGKHKDYHTFVFDGAYWNFGHVILDAEFGPGTKYNDVWWYRTGKKSEYTVKWTLTLKAKPGATVLIKDKTGAEEFSGVVGKDGTLAIPLSQCRLNPPAEYKWQEGTTKSRETVLTPHTVIVKIKGKTKTKKVTMTKKVTLKL